MDIGVNYFINGHNAKITLEYHRIGNDPREDGIGSTTTQAAAQTFSQLRMQAHIFL